jgi:hypothetical protein
MPVDIVSIEQPYTQWIQDELQPGERLLWAGRPEASRAAMQALPMLLFGIPFTLFALFWTAGATFMGGVVGGAGAHVPGPFGLFRFFGLFGVPFILVGCYLLASPFLASRKASQTVCAITDRRAITIEGGNSRSVRSFGPRDIQRIERRERDNGRGDLIFASERMNNRNGSYNREIGFVGVTNVRGAEAALRQMSGR